VNRIASSGSKLLEITNRPGWVKPFSDEVAEMIIAEADPAPRMAATNAEMNTSFRRIVQVLQVDRRGKQHLF